MSYVLSDVVNGPDQFYSYTPRKKFLIVLKVVPSRLGMGLTPQGPVACQVYGSS